MFVLFWGMIGVFENTTIVKKITKETPKVITKLDVVYMWSNTSDPSFAQIRQKYEKNPYSPTRTTGELKLSIRSLFKFGHHWLNNIYIVTTNGQKPSWLDVNDPRVHIVDANELMSSVGGTVPTFNSEAITTLFPFIEGLSEHFVTMDDDFILVKPTSISHFFKKTKTTGALSEVYHKTIVKRKCGPKLPELSLQCKYNKEIMNQSSYWCAHSVRPYIKTRFLKFLQVFHEIVSITRNNRFRHETDIDVTGVYPYFTEWYYGIENTANTPLARKQNFPVDTVVLDLKHPIWADFGRAHVVNIALQDKNTSKYYDVDTRTEVVLTIFMTIATKYGLSEPSPVEKVQRFSTHVVGHRGIGVGLPVKPHKLNSHMVSQRIPPEESLLNIQLASQYVDWVELDMMLTRDNVVVAQHGHKYIFEHCIDNNNKIPMRNTAFENVKMMGVASLRDIIKHTRSSLGFHLELKQDAKYNKECIRIDRCLILDMNSDELTKELLKTIQHYGKNNVYITAFDVQRLRLVKDLAISMGMNEIKTILSWPMYDQITDDHLERIKNKWLVDGLSLSKTYVKNHNGRKLVKHIQQHGFIVEIGMPSAGFCLHELDGNHKGETIKDIKDALLYEPDFIITNKPLVVKAITLGLNV